MEFTFYSPKDIAERVDAEQFEDAVLKIRAAHETAEVTIPYNYRGNIEGFRAALNREVTGGVVILHVGMHTATVSKLRGG